MPGAGIAFTIDYVKEFCLKKNVKILSNVYKNRKTRLNALCLTCNFSWETDFKAIGRTLFGCPNCAILQLRNSIKEINEVCKDLKIFCISTDDEYRDAHTPIWWKCKVCNFEFKRKYNSVRTGFGNQCPKCTKKIRYDLESVKEFLLTKNIICHDKTFKNVHQKLDLKCLICNYCWNTSRFAGIKNSDYNCPKCVGVAPLTQEIVEIYCKSVKISVIDRFKTTQTRMEFQCDVCQGKWKTSFSNIKNRQSGCPYCQKRKSKSERFLFESVEKFDILNGFSVKNGDRVVVNPYEIDIFIEKDDIKIAIEVNGVQHYSPIYGEKQFEIILTNDIRKREILKNKTIPLITIKNDKHGFPKEKFENVLKRLQQEIKDVIENGIHFDEIVLNLSDF